MVTIEYKQDEVKRMKDMDVKNTKAFATRLSENCKMLYVPQPQENRTVNVRFIAISIRQPEGMTVVNCNGRDKSTMKELICDYPAEVIVEATLTI